MRIREATTADLPVLAVLFDQYRQFYRLPADVPKSRTYLEDRLGAGDAVVLVAEEEGGRLIGFTQLYPTWCSLLAGPVYVLYDLYVSSAARRRGIGRALLEAAAERGRRDGKLRMTLSTAKTNRTAQSLYESLGWQLDEEYYVYNLSIS